MGPNSDGTYAVQDPGNGQNQRMTFDQLQSFMNTHPDGAGTAAAIGA